MSSTPDAAATSVSPPARKLSRRRLWLFRILTLLVMAVGQEVLFRLLFVQPEIVGFNRIRYQQMAPSHPRYAEVMQRGLVYDRLLTESRPDGFSEVHGLNVYGFRGPDFRADPDPKRRRILVIGDSAVEGWGVGDSSTITSEWSRLLAREGTPAEVVNLGIVGAGLPDLWLLTREAVNLLRPDDVVVAIYPNDVPAPFPSMPPTIPVKTFERAQADYRPKFVDLIERVVYEQPIHRRWFHPPIRHLLPVPDAANPWSDGRPRPASLRPDLFEDMRGGRLNPALYAQSQGIPDALAFDFTDSGSPEQFLESMRDACRAAGARMMVAYTPFCGVVHPRYAPALIDLGMDPQRASALATDPQYRSQNREMAAVCGRLNLPLADSTSAMEAAEAVAPQYWPYDTHPNADGYATIARHIHETWKGSLAVAPKP